MVVARQLNDADDTGDDTDGVEVFEFGVFDVVALSGDNDAFVFFLGSTKEGEGGFAAHTDGDDDAGEENVAVEGE